MKTLRELIEHADKDAVSIFKDTGHLSPIYHIVGRDGVHTIVPVPELPKELVVIIMRELMKGFDAVAYVFIDEAWSIRRSEEWVNSPDRCQPKDAPDKEELILYATESESEPALHGHRIINPKTRELGPLQINQPSKIGGMLMNLLPTKGSKH